MKATFLFGAVIATLLTGANARAQTSGAAARAQNGSRDVHIAIRVQSATGDPVFGLSKKDFAVTANGARIPVTFTTPARYQAIPTQVLVVITKAGGIGNAGEESALLKQLRPFWKRGWRVSVLTDAQTPYTTSESELQIAVNQIKKAVTVQGAIANLGQFKGQKIILYITDPGYRVNQSVRVEAREVQAMIYHVGGNPWTNYGPTFAGSSSVFDSLVHDQAGLDVPISMPTQPTYGLLLRNLREERTFAGARRDALYDSLGYYDLKLSLTQDVQIVDLTLTKGPYLVSAQTYSDTAKAPELTLQNTSR